MPKKTTEEKKDDGIFDFLLNFFSDILNNKQEKTEVKEETANSQNVNNKNSARRVFKRRF